MSSSEFNGMSLNLEQRSHRCLQGSHSINRTLRLQCTLILVRPYPLMHLQLLLWDREWEVRNLINNQRTLCSQMHSLAPFAAAFSHTIWRRGAALQVISCHPGMEPETVRLLILAARTGIQILPTPVIAWTCMLMIVPAMIFHIATVLIRSGNVKGNVISEICRHSYVVENVKIYCG